MIQFDLRLFFKWVGEKPPTRNDLEIKFLVIPTTFDASYIQIELMFHHPLEAPAGMYKTLY